MADPRAGGSAQRHGLKKGKESLGLEGQGSRQVAKSRKQVRSVAYGAKLVLQLRDKAGDNRQPC